MNKGFVETYQVWCDVGGTFTDCIVTLPNGTSRCTKVLSSGIVKGSVAHWLDDWTFIDPLRRSDPNDFWVGSKLHWIDDAGQYIDTWTCAEFDATLGRFRLSRDACDSERATGSPRMRHNHGQRYELVSGLEAPVLATRLLLGIAPDRPLPDLRVRLGTTRGTNALLTRTGEPTALVTTQGFGDLLRIGYQERPDLFALMVRKHVPLHAQVVEITERLAADGSVLVSLDLKQAERELLRVFCDGIRSIAICLIHSYVNPAHELAIAELAKRTGFKCVCVSSQIAPKIRAVFRAETALVDAYLTPVVQGYLERVGQEFGLGHGRHLRVMTSGGGLVSAEAYRGKDSVLSGPAGGAVAIEAYAKAMSLPRCIGLDMGGTSTDVCRIEGRMLLEHETVKAGVRMMIPTLAIHTVAAGGGSICWFDGVQLRVGPKSAGSDPGPACYGRGGPLTITDLNLLSNRIDETHFPFRLDRMAAQKKVEKILLQVNGEAMNGHRFTTEELCTGFRTIANEHMAAAVRSISIAQGADPREHALIGFGGAAGQHVCEIAELLGIGRVIDPPDAGLLSALGMGMASIKRSYSLPIYQTLVETTLSKLCRLAQDIQMVAVLEFDSEGIQLSQCVTSYEVELKYTGTEGSIMVPVVLPDESESHLDTREDQRLFARSVEQHFNKLHLAKFGYVRKSRPLEIVSIRAEYCSVAENRLDAIQRTSSSPPKPFEAGKTILRSDLHPGETLLGPGLIASSGSTTYVNVGWSATLLSDGTLELNRTVGGTDNSVRQMGATEGVDPVLREVLAQRIAAIAEQMGIVLEQTAISVNVKDRRDFSCAVFAANGDLIANAPHVPVHLGAMSQTIRCMLRRFPMMLPGDCFVTNDPYQGGSHLPDVTVITPVFADLEMQERDCNNDQVDRYRQHRQPDFFVACRAHHAEIGGIAPGSMAPTSTRLFEEGVIIPPMYLTKQGEDRSDGVAELLRGGPFPSRAVAENMADLAAQQAANQRGAFAMLELVQSYGLETVQHYLEHIQSASETKTRAWIATLGPEVRSFRDQMDDGTLICVSITPTCNPSRLATLHIDFSGTGPVSQGNLNANPAIVSAAVMYVIRCALSDTLPLNSGVLRCVELNIPEGILNPPVFSDPSQSPAVAGGNVETSQRVVDCLLGALGLAAASQGTMNNFLFGDPTFGYYETIGGGSGATSQGKGEDAVHCHMTNTRLTDVEILERRYPVRLVRFAIRHGSGGSGFHAGGCGMIRQVQALSPLDVSLVTSRRTCAPFGINGGEDGKPGENWLLRASGERIAIASSAQFKIETGDSILIETPGGGGSGVKLEVP
ncbi:MAG: hydantoinase B/oxoprolinase family protein [Pirellula sp.]